MDNIINIKALVDKKYVKSNFNNLVMFFNNNILKFDNVSVTEKEIFSIIKNIVNQKSSDSEKLIQKIFKNAKINFEQQHKNPIQFLVLKYFKENIKNINNYNKLYYSDIIKNYFFNYNSSFLPEIYQQEQEYRDTIKEMLSLIQENTSPVFKFSIYIKNHVFMEKEEYKDFVQDNLDFFSYRMIIGENDNYNNYNFNVFIFKFLSKEIPYSMLDGMFRKIYNEIKDKKEEEFSESDFIFLHLLNFIKEKNEDFSLPFMLQFPVLKIEKPYNGDNVPLYVKKTISSLLENYGKNLDRNFESCLEKHNILNNIQLKEIEQEITNNKRKRI